MPAPLFFIMLDESVLIQAAHYSELADIQAISICQPKYHEQVKERYRRILAGDEPEGRPQADVLPIKSKQEPLRGADAKHAMMAMFSGGGLH